MSKDKRICLLGFTQETESKIKSLITNYATTQSVEWVPANDKNLDGVVINAGFLEAPQIQKYIGMVRCPIVCVYSTDEGKNLAEKHNLLSISAQDNAPRTDWLSHLFGETITVAESASSSASPAPSATTSAAESNASASLQTGKTDSDGQILKRIRRGENVVFCAENGDNKTWIKPAEGLAYINYAREKVPGYDKWTWQEVSPHNIPPSARQLRVDLWLFETLWQSQLDGARHVDQNAHFRLIRWPQPLSRQGRTEALRLAACAQGYPVDIKTLCEKTNYTKERVNRFLFATIFAGQTEEIQGAVQVPVPETKPMDEQKKQEKRSLLQRFRAKLGL